MTGRYRLAMAGVGLSLGAPALGAAHGPLTPQQVSTIKAAMKRNPTAVEQLVASLEHKAALKAAPKPRKAQPKPAAAPTTTTTTRPAHVWSVQTTGGPDTSSSWSTGGSTNNVTGPMALTLTPSQVSNDVQILSVTAQVGFDPNTFQPDSQQVSCSISLDGHVLDAQVASGPGSIADCTVTRHPFTGQWGPS